MDALLEDALVPDATLPVESPVPDATLPAESLVPDTTLPVESLVPDATLPADTELAEDAELALETLAAASPLSSSAGREYAAQDKKHTDGQYNTE